MFEDEIFEYLVATDQINEVLNAENNEQLDIDKENIVLNEKFNKNSDLESEKSSNNK